MTHQNGTATMSRYIMQQVTVTEKLRETQKKMPTNRIPRNFAPSRGQPRGERTPKVGGES